jgi:hypothetical protein
MWMIVRHLICLHHDYGIAAEPNIIFLRCTKCGHRTAGWTIAATRGSTAVIDHDRSSSTGTNPITFISGPASDISHV